MALSIICDKCGAGSMRHDAVHVRLCFQDDREGAFPFNTYDLCEGCAETSVFPQDDWVIKPNKAGGNLSNPRRTV